MLELHRGLFRGLDGLSCLLRLHIGPVLGRRRDFVLHNMRGWHLPVRLGVFKLRRWPVLCDGRRSSLHQLPNGSLLGVFGCGIVDGVRELHLRSVRGCDWCERLHELFPGYVCIHDGLNRLLILRIGQDFDRWCDFVFLPVGFLLQRPYSHRLLQGDLLAIILRYVN